MKIELGKTYETKGGYSCRIICIDRKINSQYKIIGLVESNGQESSWCFDENGRCAGYSVYDLKPKTKKIYSFYYKNKITNKYVIYSIPRDSEEERNTAIEIKKGFGHYTDFTPFEIEVEE